MIKKIISHIFLIFGVLFIVVAAILFWYDSQQELVARTDSENVVDIIRNEIDIDAHANAEVQKEIEFDNSSYIGILEIPILELELPVQDSWSYPKLKSAPCIYKENPMSIAAHNYQAHFGRLKNLVVGDIAVFTFISGEIKEYQVTSVTTIHETDMEAFNDSESDLTLFTCNYSNNTERVVVRLQETKEQIYE